MLIALLCYLVLQTSHPSWYIFVIDRILLKVFHFKVGILGGSCPSGDAVILGVVSVIDISPLALPSISITLTSGNSQEIMKCVYFYSFILQDHYIIMSFTDFSDDFSASFPLQVIFASETATVCTVS